LADNNELAVSAVIVNFNGAAHLQGCLPSLLAQSHKALEIIVVDNASRDESSQVAREFGVTWLPLSANIGLAPALNRGAAIAKGDLLLFLNNDMRFDQHFIAALVGPLVQDDAVFATDGMQYPWDGGEPVHTATRLAKVRPNEARAVEFVPGLWFYQEPPKGITEALFASAACMLVRRTFFQAIGGFDERLPLGYEDAEICWRARLHDWKVLFVPQAVCWHRVSGSSRSPAAALLNFRGIIIGRLILSTKLLPVRFALRTWFLSMAGVAKDLSRARGSYAIARVALLMQTARQVPQLIRERKTLYREARRTSRGQLESLFQLGNGDAH
jgi:N-acetylglucosaminyl-diphospho-decaprenol L-rhamnosyltransferase